MEDYGFEYSDEDPEEEDVDIENQYYNAKGTSCKLWTELLYDTYLARSIRSWKLDCWQQQSSAVHVGMLEGDDCRDAIDGFKQVVQMEQDKGEWYVEGIPCVHRPRRPRDARVG